MIEKASPFDFLQKLRAQDQQHTAAVSALSRARIGAVQRMAGVGGSAPAPAGDLQWYARQRMQQLGMGGANDWQALYNLWQKESGWNPNAVNRSSGAFGIAQILPEAHPDVPRNLTGQQQIDWGLNYIKQRYGNPSNAWAHSQQTDWY